MTNSTCRLLSNGYKFQLGNTNRLHLMPCCMWTGEVEQNPENFKKYRNMLLEVNGTTDVRCRHCQHQEKLNVRDSWRQHSFNIVPDDAQPGDATYLEIQLDNTCNGGCIMCGPWHSSYWAAELKQLQPASNNLIDTVLSYIDIQQARNITFLGGEPFLTDADYKLLSLIKHPELVTLKYTTNGSIYPTQQRIDQWSKFKAVWINFSIDGVGDRFEYIRYPLKWNVVNKNIKRMIQEMPNNVIFKANHTVNIFNLYYYDEFDNWYSEVKKLGRLADYTFNPAVGVVSAFSVTDKLLALLKNKYHSDSKILKLVNNNVDNDKTAMINFITELDTRRGLDWRTVFPEIADCF